jgi:FAD/FMN-containing dehydrogenase
VKACVYEPLRGIGGSISAEHGIGLERKHFLEISRTPAEIAAMRAIKAALDPKRILNPGKVFD